VRCQIAPAIRTEYASRGSTSAVLAAKGREGRTQTLATADTSSIAVGNPINDATVVARDGRSLGSPPANKLDAAMRYFASGSGTVFSASSINFNGALANSRNHSRTPSASRSC